MSKFNRVLALGAAAIGAGGGYWYYAKQTKVTLKTFTDPSVWQDLKIKSFKDVSHDSREFVFELPSPNHVSGLETASLVLAKYTTAKGNPVIRPYTPVSTDDERGEMKFVIKKYPDSKFGTYIFGLKPEDTVSFKGPIQKFKWVPNKFDSVTLIGGGSGITPLFQIVQKVANDPNDKTKVHLIYGSKAPEDILLKQELDAFVAKHPEKIKVDYFVDKADKFDGHVGFITKEFLASTVPKPSDKTHAFVCGPSGLYKSVSGEKASKTDQGPVTGVLGELGYTSNEVFKF